MLAQSQGPFSDSSSSLLSDSQPNSNSYTALSTRQRVAGRLHVEILGARNLPPMKLGSLLKWSQNYSNPYVKVTLDRTEFVTSTKRQTVDPAWKEAEYLDMPLASEQQLLQSIGVASERRHAQSIAKKLVQSIHVDNRDKVAFHPCFPELHVQVYHQQLELDDDESVDPMQMHQGQRDNDPDEPDPVIGTAMISLLPCLLSSSSTLRAWYPLVGADGSGKGGQIQLNLQYEAGGIEPKHGDLVRLTGFGGMEYYSKLFTINAQLEVATTFQDQVLVQTKSKEGWALSFEMHRNLLFVTHRPSIIRDAQHQLQGQFSRVKRSRVLTSASHMWQRLSPARRQQLSQMYQFTALSSATAYGVVNMSLRTATSQGLRAGVRAYVDGTSDGIDKVSQAFVTMYWVNTSSKIKETLTDELTLYLEGGPMRGRGRITRAFGLINDDADTWGAEDEIFSDEDEQEIDSDDTDQIMTDTDSLKPRTTLELKQGSVPEQLICPITGCLMEDPVVAADGHSYERAAIERWLRTKNVSPMTGLPMATTQVFPNLTLRNLSQDYRQHPSQ